MKNRKTDRQLQKICQMQLLHRPVSLTAKRPGSSGKKAEISYKEQREYETIDEDIAKLEEKIEKLDREMVKNATNP